MGIAISLIIGYAVLLWIIGFFMGKEPWTFALKGTGITIALGFLAFFLFMLKVVIFQ